MKRILLGVLTLLIFTLPATAAGIDETINAATAPIASLIGQIVFFKIPVFGAQLPLVVLWLVVGAVFFTVYLGFINLRGFKHAINVVRGRFTNPDAHGAGEVSHFQALTTALPSFVRTVNPTTLP